MFSQDKQMKLVKSEINDEKTLSIETVNELGEVVENISFTLEDARGNSFGAVKYDGIYHPQHHFFMEFPLMEESIYTLFYYGQPVIRFNSDKISGSFYLPEEMQLLAISKGAKNELTSEIIDLGEKLDATIAIYNSVAFEGHPVNELINRKYTFVDNPYLDFSNKIIPVMIQGDLSQKKEALQHLIDEIVAYRKDYSDKSIFLVSHAHQDLYWLWNHQESVKMMQDNLRQATTFLNEFPQYKFSQSQAAIYQEIEKSDPVVFEEIKKFVQEGRFELLGGQWSEGDTNLSSGEAIARSLLIGQNYYMSRFNKIAKVGWLPDNFGHAGQLPQLLNLAGIDSYYFNRCAPYRGSFVWEGIDGSKVLAYSNPSYVTHLRTNIYDDFENLIPTQDRLFHVLGVGDHGGGPTRLDIKTELGMNKIDRFPSIQFTTAEQFFNHAYQDIDQYPVHKGEMQFVFEGCYTSVAGIKEGNRNGEARLFESEILNSINYNITGTYPQEKLNEAWQGLTFNQFHDILPGSSIFEANKDAMSTYNQVERTAKETRDFAFRNIADQINLKEDLGQPVVAFNFQPHRGKVLVEAEVFSYDKPFTAEVSHWSDYYGYNNILPVDRGQGKYPTAKVTDGKGNYFQAQIISGKLFPPGYRVKVLFVVPEMPAGGFKTFYVDLSDTGEHIESKVDNNYSFETEYFYIRINPETGRINSLVDRESGKEFASGELNSLNIYAEDKGGSMKAWSLSKVNSIEEIKTDSVKIVEYGPVRACVESHRTWGNSQLIERCFIYKSYPRVDYSLEVHWLETGSKTKDSPMLRALFPINLNEVTFSSHVPFGVIDRPTNGQEVPAQRWVDISDKNYGISLLNKTKYGHSYQDDTLSLTLLRSSSEPDYYPNLGRMIIDYALFPHTGDWQNWVWQEGDVFNNPVYAAEPASLSMKPEASLPEEKTFYELSSPEVVITGIKKAENSDKLIIRLCEISGTEKEISLKLDFAVNDVQRMDILERKLSNAAIPLVDNNIISLTVKPFEIITIGID